MAASVMAQENAINWHLWCRLCAKDDIQGNINVFLKNEQSPGDAASVLKNAAAGSDLELATAIGKYFWVNITRGEDLPEMICTECLTLVTSLVNFSERITRVQKLYCILQSMPKQEQIDANALRLKFGLLDEERTMLLPRQTLTEVHYLDEKPKLNEQGLLEETFELQNPLTPCLPNENENIKSDSNAEHPYDAEEQLEEDNEIEEDDCNAYADDDSESEYSEANSDASQKPASQKHQPYSRKKHKQRTYQCTQCSKAYANSQSLTRHIRREHHKEMFVCTECEKEFCTRFSLDRHMQSHLPMLRRKVHPCDKCGKKFTSPASVQSHYQYMHQDGRPPRPFICEQCGVAVHSNASLKEHMLCHTDETPFECDECKKCFKSASRLKHHKETHDPHKYICPECGMQLNSRTTLNRHRLVHTDQMQHKCDYCGRAFKRAKALKNHLILHTGLKPYSCDFCERTFANGSNCRTHKKKSHPEELAAQEAAGGGKPVNRNIPKLAALKAFTKNKDNLSPVATKQSGCFAFGKKPKPLKTTMVNNDAETETNTATMTTTPTVSSIPTIDNIYNHILKQTPSTAEKEQLSNSFDTPQIITIPTESGAAIIQVAAQLPNNPTESSNAQFTY